MIAIGDRAFASTMAADLAEAMIDLDDDDEAWRFAKIARDTSATDDVTSQAGGRAVQARVLSRQGDHDNAVSLAREAVAITAGTDSLVERGDMLLRLAQVLWSAGEAGDALAAARDAIGFYQRKGATLLAERAQLLIDTWTTS
jgi:tetratricopeptide (TPR) repeat protein